MFQSEILRVCEGYLDLLPTVDNRYKLVKDIGVSRFGKVYMAVDMQKGELVAIKSLIHWRQNLTHLQMFLNEMLNLTKIQKMGRASRVCSLLAFNFHGRYRNGKPIVYFVMEFKEMGDLLSLVDSMDQNLSTKLVGFFHHQICLAIRDIQGANIAHLDLKPDNIVIDDQLNLFLCDFGHSLDVSKPMLLRSKKQKKISTSQMEKLSSRSFVGSMQYCAPEVHEFQNELDETEPDPEIVSQSIKQINFFKCDVFGAGVVMFVQLHKTFPFNKAHNQDLHFLTMIQKPQIYWKSIQCIRIMDQDFRDYFYQTCETQNAKRASIKDVLAHHWIQDNRFHFAEEAREEMKEWIRSKKQAFIQDLLERFKDQRRDRKVGFFVFFLFLWILCNK